jgi:uncharacterized protein YggE
LHAPFAVRLRGASLLALAAALIVALLALVPASAAAQTATVTVSGSEARLVPNDAARVSLAVVKDRRTARAALNATTARIRAVIRRVRAAGGLAGADLTTGPVSVSKRVLAAPDGAARRVVYRARQSVTAIVRRVRRTGAVIAAGVRAGATAVRGPEYFVSDSEAVYRNALLAAFDAAREKATALARQAGRELGPVVSIEERGGVRVVPFRGEGDSGAGAPGQAAPPVRPGKSRVRALVRVVFELQ